MRSEEQIEELESKHQHVDQESPTLWPPFISSVKVVVKSGRIDLNEDFDKNVEEFEMVDPTVSSLCAQTFRLQFEGMTASHIIQHEVDRECASALSKVAYVTLKIHDVTLLEFDEVLEPFTDCVCPRYLDIHHDDNIHQRVAGKAFPLLFKTLEQSMMGMAHHAADLNEKEESDVLHLFLSMRVKNVEGAGLDVDSVDEEKGGGVNAADREEEDRESIGGPAHGAEDTFLQIFTLVNLRALTHEFRLQSEWGMKLGEFFSVDTTKDTLRGNDCSNPLQNVTNVYVNAYDCCISYNPIPQTQRLVIASEKIRMSTNVVALSPMISLSVECRDGAVFLHPNALKRLPCSLSDLFASKRQLAAPFLHRLPGNLLSDHLESIGFVNVLHFDWIEAFLSQNKAAAKRAEVTLSGGNINLQSCADSTRALLSIMGYFIDQVIEQPPIEEVELLLPDSSHDTEPLDEVDSVRHSPPHSISQPLKEERVERSHTMRSHYGVDHQIEMPIIDDGSKVINFNLLGNIDEHMFSGNSGRIDDIGIDSDSSEQDGDQDWRVDDGGGCGDDDNGGIELIQEYARVRSIPESGTPNREYVEMSMEDATPFVEESFGSIQAPPLVDTAGQSAGWYDQKGDDSMRNQQELDVDYLDKKLKERFHCLTDPNLPDEYPRPQTQIKIKSLRALNWKIFGGHDFEVRFGVDSSASTGDSDEHQYFELEYDEKAVDDDGESKNEYNASQSANINYRSNRKVDEVMQFCLHQIGLSFYQFAATEHVASRLVIGIGNVVVHDLIKSSPFYKLLCRYIKECPQGHINKEVFKLEMNSLRPEPKSNPERVECELTMRLQPLRLNVDQDAIDFVVKFFTAFGCADGADPHDADLVDDESEDEAPDSVDATESVSRSATPSSSLIDAVNVAHPKEAVEDGEREANGKDSEVYFQRFCVDQVTVCVDYKPHRVDFDRLRNGDYSQFVHLFPLSQVEIGLQPFEAQGCEGWDSCFVELAKFWAIDFATHQAHRYVAGIQPVRSLVTMGSGIADLVIIPLQQYQHDGRITKGLQRGAQSAVHKITLETLELGDGIFTTISEFLSSLEGLLHSKATRKKRRDNKRMKRQFMKKRTHYLSHNVKRSEGLRAASESFTKGIIDAAHSIAFVPMEKYKSSGVRAVPLAVLRGVPSAILHPLIGGTRAVSNVLSGVKSSIDVPERQFEGTLNEQNDGD